MKNKPVVWIDSREKENSHVTEYFDSKPIDHFTSKLPYGDYMSLDNARVIVERKCGILEMVSTLGKDHERFKKELKEAGFDGVLMSGSGSTVFGITKDKELVEKTMEKLKKQRYFVRHTNILV